MPTSSCSSVKSSSTRPSFAMVPILPNAESCGRTDANRTAGAPNTGARPRLSHTVADERPQFAVGAANLASIGQEK